MESLIERLAKLKSEGYDKNFVVKNNLIFISGNNHKKLETKDITIDKVYRIEADSDPTHQSIVYALSCRHPKAKGVLINSYGPYSEQDIDSFIEKLSS